MRYTRIIALPLLLSSFLSVSATPLQSREPSPGLIDDLLQGILSPIEQILKEILTGAKSGISDVISAKPLICMKAMDPCCPWYDVSAALVKAFTGADGQCNDSARAAVRLGFHDAGSWDKNSPNGGADGSILMDFGEQDRSENNGLQEVRILLRGVKTQYGVGYADLVQYAHNLATIVCPKGPRVRTFVGRPDATKAAPTGLLPDTNDTPDNLINLFKNKGFTPEDLAALLGAHTTAKQRFVDTTHAGQALDTTPGVWDVEFYNDTLNNQSGSNSKVFVLPSDKKLSTHPLMADEWKGYVGNQPEWNEHYAKAYVRMSLTGVTKLRSLTECTRTLPAKTKTK